MSTKELRLAAGQFGRRRLGGRAGSGISAEFVSPGRAFGRARVTNLECGFPEWIYDSLYCARGQAENLIKLHKTQLSSDRTSCRSAVANQVRLVLHTCAYWLMLTVRDAIPKQCDLAKAEFATLRLRLLKIAARVIETARAVRLAFAACHPEAALFASLPGALAPLGP
jgi:hypothetical protein